MSLFVAAALIGQWGDCGVCTDPPARKQNFSLDPAVPRAGVPSPPLLGQPAYRSPSVVPPSPMPSPAPVAVSAQPAAGVPFFAPAAMQGGTCYGGSCGSGMTAPRRGLFGGFGRRGR